MFKRDKIRLEAIRKEAREAREARDLTHKRWQNSVNFLLGRISYMDERLRRIAPYLYGMDDVQFDVSQSCLLDAKNNGRLQFRVSFPVLKGNEIDFYRQSASCCMDMLSMHVENLNLLEAKTEARTDHMTGEHYHLLRVRVGDKLNYNYGYTDDFVRKFGWDIHDLSEVITASLLEHHREKDHEQRRSNRV